MYIMLFICKRLQIKIPPGVGKEENNVKKIKLLSMVVLVTMMISMLTPGASAITYQFKGILGTWYDINPDTQIMYGSSGTYVKVCQATLKSLTSYNPGSVDGLFGTGTKSAVESYQYAKNLYPIDGIVGPQTWSQLYLTFYSFMTISVNGGLIVWGLGSI